jgi:peptidoglycan/LPS O-acetylase OafA/YrhL
LFGVRLLSILVVIICHKAGFIAAGPTKNPEFQEQVCDTHCSHCANNSMLVFSQLFSQLQYMPVLHGDLVVDTFFFLAGFLLTVSLLKVLRRPIPGISVSVWPLYFCRYLR